jgi:hypothetical protein
MLVGGCLGSIVTFGSPPVRAIAQQNDEMRIVVLAQEYYDQALFDEVISLLKTPTDNESLFGKDLQKARELLARSYVKRGETKVGKETFKAILHENEKWRPDKRAVPPDEVAVFDEALKEFLDERSVKNSSEGNEEPENRTHESWGVVGLVGGASFGRLNVEPSVSSVDDSGTRKGFVLGGVLGVRVSDNTMLELDLLYVQNGGTYRSGSGNSAQEGVYKYDYFTIPVLLRFDLTSSSRPYVVFGPTLCFLGSAEIEWVTSSGEEHQIDANERVKSGDFGVCIGMGFNISAGNHWFSIEGRYVHGFSDINDIPREVTGEDFDIRTRSIQLLAGVGIPQGQ